MTETETTPAPVAGPQFTYDGEKLATRVDGVHWWHLLNCVMTHRQLVYCSCDQAHRQYCLHCAHQVGSGRDRIPGPCPTALKALGLLPDGPDPAPKNEAAEALPEATEA